MRFNLQSLWSQKKHVERQYYFFHMLLFLTICSDVRVKRHFAPNLISTNCSAAKQLPQFSNIRNPLIYYVNRCFLMFGGSQVQKSYRASTNDFLTFWPDIIKFCYKYITKQYHRFTIRVIFCRFVTELLKKFLTFL